MATASAPRADHPHSGGTAGTCHLGRRHDRVVRPVRQRTASHAARFSHLELPVLQIGSDSPRDLYATDALAAVLPDARIEPLPGQAHEGMTTAPGMYADSVIRFLLGDASPAS
jgi:hypothetical protein